MNFCKPEAEVSVPQVFLQIKIDSLKPAGRFSNLQMTSIERCRGALFITGHEIELAGTPP
jgi:hypothetical protein